MLGMGMKVVAHREPWSGMVAIRMGKVSLENNHTTFVAKPVEFHTEALKVNEEVVPFMQLAYEEAQMFMDSLWAAGLRPTEGTGSAGAMAAVQAHLKDMRALVFKGEVPK